MEELVNLDLLHAWAVRDYANYLVRERDLRVLCRENRITVGPLLLRYCELNRLAEEAKLAMEQSAIRYYDQKDDPQ
jgi:hypothetical protein